MKWSGEIAANSTYAKEKSKEASTEDSRCER